MVLAGQIAEALLYFFRGSGGTDAKDLVVGWRAHHLFATAGAHGSRRHPPVELDHGDTHENSH